MEIVSGLESAAVQRLKETWQSIPPKYSKSYQELQTLMSPEGNFRNYREEILKAAPPGVPYIGSFGLSLKFFPTDFLQLTLSLFSPFFCTALVPALTTGIFLSELTFLDETHAWYLEDKKLNVTKLKIVGEIIRKMRRFHENSYNFLPNESLRLSLQLFDIPLLGAKEAYQKSKQHDEKGEVKKGFIFTLRNTR
jgi:hypothetical protein